MSEIEVVVDVRQSPDTGELVVSKRTLAVNGEARLVGAPVEERVPGPAKARVGVFGLAEGGTPAMAARVKNVGAMAFVVASVRLTVDLPAGESAFDLVPADGATLEPLKVGEERLYRLPDQHYDEAALLALALGGDRFRVAVVCGAREVGRAGGEDVRRAFAETGLGLAFHRRAAPLFQTLPDAERLAVVRAVAPLRKLASGRWRSVGAKPLEGEPHLFVVRAMKDLFVVVAATEDGQVLLDDIVRDPGEGVVR